MRVRKKDFDDFPKLQCTVVSDCHHYSISAVVKRRKLYLLCCSSNSLYRTIITRTDFLSLTSDEKKRKSKIVNLLGYCFWDKRRNMIYIDSQSEEAIKSFIGEYEGNCIEGIEEYQGRIRKKQLVAKKNRDLQKVTDAMRGIKFKPVLNYTKFFDSKMAPYCVYERVNRRGDYQLTCSRTRKQMIINKQEYAKEYSFEIKHNKKTQCPICGKDTHLKAKGLFKSSDDRDEFNFIEVHNGNFWTRTYSVIRRFGYGETKKFSFDSPKWYLWETKRKVLLPDGSIRFFYKDYDKELKRTIWKELKDDNYGCSVRNSTYVGDIAARLKGTLYENSGIEVYLSYRSIVDPVEYMSRHLEGPGVEVLAKLKYHNVLSRVINYCPENIDITKKRLKDILNVDNGFIRRHRAHSMSYSAEDFELWKGLNEIGVYDDNLFNFLRNNNHVRPRDALRLSERIHKHPKKILEFMSKYGLYYAYYRDYLDYAAELGKDITKKDICFSKGIRKLHDEYYKTLQQIRNAEADRKMKLISENLQRLAFQDEKLLIRPSKSTDELLAEGKALKHCVGTYAKRIKEGRSLIFFIRNIEEVDIPYYTLELNPKTYEVVQCRGEANCSMSDEIKGFVECWKASIEEMLKSSPEKELSLTA